MTGNTLACAISTMFLASAFAQDADSPFPVTQVLPQVDVTGQALPEPGTTTTISGAELDRATNMKDVVRNQPRPPIYIGAGTTHRSMDGTRTALSSLKIRSSIATPAATRCS